MTLQECLDRLARGKLSNLAICEKGSVKPQEIPRVIDAVNDGTLTEDRINESLRRVYRIKYKDKVE